MVIYQGLQIFAGSLLTLAFRHWVKKEEKHKERTRRDLGAREGLHRGGGTPGT
jgi:hypothetical protein